MANRDRNSLLILTLFIMHINFAGFVFSEENASLLEITPPVMEYVVNTVKPLMGSSHKKDKLSLLLKVSSILIDPEIGISANKIDPNRYIVYGMLDKIKLGFLTTLGLSSKQKQILKDWHSKYMYNHPADVFFAPSAAEIIKTKSAFGCTHYARAFIAVVKALGLVDNPEDLRYVISCKADDYNRAFEQRDSKMSINGHQFVIVKINSRWIAINTSKGKSSPMPKDFSPDTLAPPHNIAIRFYSYPDITFLLRKIGKDYNDDCEDNSLLALMNISRSGNSSDCNFKWEKYVAVK